MQQHNINEMRGSRHLKIHSGNPFSIPYPTTGKKKQQQQNKTKRKTVNNGNFSKLVCWYQFNL